VFLPASVIACSYAAAIGASVSSGTRPAAAVSQASSHRAAGWPVISLNSSRRGAAARPERSGPGVVSSCRATNGATSRGAVRRVNRLAASHRLRTSLAARHALLPCDHQAPGRIGRARVGRAGRIVGSGWTERLGGACGGGGISGFAIPEGVPVPGRVSAVMNRRRRVVGAEERAPPRTGGV
jgi:hypothetical protein